MGFSFKSVFKAAVTAAVVALAVGVTIGTGGATLAFYVTSAAVMAAATATVSQLLAETPKDFDLSQQLRGQLISVRAPAADAYVVYGETRIGGTIVHVETTGSKNETLYQSIVMAGHEIDSVQQVYVNDEAFSLTPSGNIFTINYKGSTSVLNLNYRDWD